MNSAHIANHKWPLFFIHYVLSVLHNKESKPLALFSYVIPTYVHTIYHHSPPPHQTHTHITKTYHTKSPLNQPINPPLKYVLLILGITLLIPKSPPDNNQANHIYKNLLTPPNETNSITSQSAMLTITQKETLNPHNTGTLPSTPLNPQTPPILYLPLWPQIQYLGNAHVHRTNATSIAFYIIKHTHLKHPTYHKDTSYIIDLQTLILLGGNIQPSP